MWGLNPQNSVLFFFFLNKLCYFNKSQFCIYWFKDLGTPVSQLLTLFVVPNCPAENRARVRMNIAGPCPVTLMY